MCRIALTNGGSDLEELLGDMQKAGGNRHVESWKNGETAMILNRFAVTSERVAVRQYPLQGKRYVLCYNGEVYGHAGRNFVDERRHESDVHFALDVLEKEGIEAFLADVDFQGSLLIHDKAHGIWYAVVDQLNTAGCFFADYKGNLVLASEHAVIHAALEQLGAPAHVPINILKNGTYLKIDRDGSQEAIAYRNDARQVYSGTEYSAAHFERKVEDIAVTLREAIRLRIPIEGDVGVLCSGGLDSSIVCAQAASILREQRMLDRLRIFTLGDTQLGLQSEENDLRNVFVLMEHLGLDPARHLHVIHPREIAAVQRYLLREKVFTARPRLITPNPILRTQVRHTVMMSALLGSIVRIAPNLTSILSGDAADELFAGYNSMRSGVQNAEDMRRNIRQKLDDFPLNDAARISLSCFHGTTSALHSFAFPPNRGHPLEVRMPFTSHRVLQSLRDAHPDYVIGKEQDAVLSKYLLRKVGKAIGLPMSIAMRKKIPFNEGGSGNRNGEPNASERETASLYCSTESLRRQIGTHEASLRRLHILDADEKLDQRSLVAKHDELALYLAGFSAGLGRLLNGNAFRESMPDSSYSTHTMEQEYVPAPLS
ncbi:hypothetical protein FJZ27_03605 [Candidatus Peribacteria bacterium]|nr:hypothetical protein [Candidatus Peribacteria bacterium]